MDWVPLLSGIDASGWQRVYTDQLSAYRNPAETMEQGELEAKGATPCRRRARSSRTMAK